MSGTFIITSGAYSGPDFTAIFGRLPPAFLPAGNRRLYEIQAELVADIGSRKILSLPEDFSIPADELERLTNLDFELVFVPDGLSLGQSVAWVIDTADIADGELRILHGDTLLFDFPFGSVDLISEGQTGEYQSWAESRQNNDGSLMFFDGLPEGPAQNTGNRLVLSGFFSFSDAAAYKAALRSSGQRFIPALNDYAKSRPLKTLNEGRWLDFGHLDDYYQSNAELTVGRSFNEMNFSRRKVRKSSADTEKIRAEANWFESVPADVKVFAPQYLGSFANGGGSEEGYETEYLYLSPLSDLLVFGRLPVYVWQRIFQACDEFLLACQFHRPDKSINVDALYQEKTLARLEAYARQSGVSLAEDWHYNGTPLPGLAQIAEATAGHIPEPTADHLQIVHGDFCFSNIFYDFRANAIRVVDPRGYLHASEVSIYGDVRYDIAKLYHSVVGGYDKVMAGQFALTIPGDHALELSLPAEDQPSTCASAFMEARFAGHKLADTAADAIAVLLFLSMLPLHGDHPERQSALLACALRLFSRLER